jgi:hypothetical protein
MVLQVKRWVKPVSSSAMLRIVVMRMAMRKPGWKEGGASASQSSKKLAVICWKLDAPRSAIF